MKNFCASITLLTYSLSLSGSIDSPIVIIVFIFLILVSISLFIKPLWPIEIGLFFQEETNKLLFKNEKLFSYIEEHKQRIQNEDDIEYGTGKQIVKLFSIVILLIAGILFWGEICE